MRLNRIALSTSEGARAGLSGMAVADAASKVDDTKAGGWYSKDEGVFSVKVGEAVGSGRGAERVAGLEVARGQVQLPEREGEGGRCVSWRRQTEAG